MIPVHRLAVMLRFLLVLGVSCLAFGVGSSDALGFGPSKLHSYLNEPLNLDIELLDAETQGIDNLTASLASVDDFKRADMQRPYFLSRFRFEVKRIGRRSYINVTSPDAMKHPFLDFLVDLAWPGGHTVKGYTILLDPVPATSAQRNALPHFAQDTKANYKNEGKTSDRQNMESLFGPEDKTQIPVSPKIETLAQDSAQAGQLESTQHDSPPNDHSDQYHKIDQQDTSIPNTAPNMAKVSAGKDATSDLNTHNTTQKILPVHPKIGASGLPFWLFWGSILALLCIVSLTIWALNKYRLAKPKSRSGSKYYEPDPSLTEALGLKLLLAAQYIEVNDKITAKKLLDEIIDKGHDQQKAEAENLLLKMSSHG